MNKIEQEFAKSLNHQITQEKFKDEPIDQYIYASLSQPPIKILNKNNSDDIFEYNVECPNCHRAVCYGTDTFMISGHIYCSDEQCRKQVTERVMKAHENY